MKSRVFTILIRRYSSFTKGRYKYVEFRVEKVEGTFYLN